MEKIKIYDKLKNSSNKKAFITNPLVDIFVYIVFIMFVIVVLTLLNYSGGTIERSVNSEFQDIDIEKSILSYMRTPIKINSNEIQISDLFVLFYSLDDEDFKKTHKKIIQEDLTEILSEQGKFFCWSLVFPNNKDNRDRLDKISSCNSDGEKTTNIMGTKKLDFFIPIFKEAPLRVQLRYSHITNRAKLREYGYI